MILKHFYYSINIKKVTILWNTFNYLFEKYNVFSIFILNLNENKILIAEKKLAKQILFLKNAVENKNKKINKSKLVRDFNFFSYLTYFSFDFIRIVLHIFKVFNS